MSVCVCVMHVYEYPCADHACARAAPSQSKDAVCFTATAVAGAGDSPSLTFTSPNGPLAVAGPDGAPVSVWTLVCRGGDVILAAAEPPARVVWNPAAAPPLSLQSEAEVGTPLRPIFRNRRVAVLLHALV